jgi:hypothetical protein
MVHKRTSKKAKKKVHFSFPFVKKKKENGGDLLGSEKLP